MKESTFKKYKLVIDKWFVNGFDIDEAYREVYNHFSNSNVTSKVQKLLEFREIIRYADQKAGELVGGLTLKTLQKLTGIENEADLKLFVGDHPEVDLIGLERFFIKRLNALNPNEEPQKWQTFSSLMLAMVVVNGDEGQVFEQKNALYEFNHNWIIVAISNFLKKNNTMPTVSHLRDITGISRVTIYKHLEDEKTRGLNSKHKLKQRMLANDAIQMLYQIGVEDRNPSALKTYLQYAIPEAEGRVINNYVQINNIRLSQEDIQALPPAEIERIEQILKPFKKPGSIPITGILNS